MLKDYYASIDIYDMTIIKDDKEFDFNYANKINIVQNCNKDFIIMDLEIIIDKIEDVLKDGNCIIIAKSKSKNGNTGVNFIKEYKFNKIKLVSKTTLNIEVDGINRYIYVLSNEANDTECANSLVESYLLNEKINEFIFATNEASRLIAKSLMDINNRQQLVDESLCDIREVLKDSLKPQKRKTKIKWYNN